MNALETGLALLPMTASTAVMALFAGRVVPRLGEWLVVVAALTFGAFGTLLVALDAGHAWRCSDPSPRLGHHSRCAPRSC